MRHYGDITKLSGCELPFVDCIVGGSPCQDLSIAGARKGLDGERSSLFLEQIRIVKEMRDESLRTTGIARPRFLVWENVPGAFSSNGGKDFKTVLEEACRIAEPQAPDVPMPKKWPKSGCLYDELGRWSVAWRVHDAQFWGVPQRRKRIALVADFRGMCAPEVLFEREGLRWDSAESGEQRKTTSESIEGSVGNAISFQERGGKPGGGKGILIQNDRVGALSTLNNQHVFCLQANSINLSDGAGANGKGWNEDTSFTLNTTDRHVIVFEPRTQDGHARVVEGDISPTLNTAGGGQRQPCIVALFIGNGQVDQTKLSDKVGALNCMHDQQAVMVAAVDCRNMTENLNINRTLQAKSTGGIGVNFQNVCRIGSSVRRLTPLECERLQGYPDGYTDIGEWTDSNGKKHKPADSPRYKALGNSIALPFWFYLMRRISAQYERPATLGSLFDGIGGFPLVWEKCNGQGTAIWASEIEEFCIAITKKHFPEGTENKWPN